MGADIFTLKHLRTWTLVTIIYADTVTTFFHFFPFTATNNGDITITVIFPQVVFIERGFMAIYGTAIGFLSTEPTRVQKGNWQGCEFNLISNSGFNQSRTVTQVTCLGFAKVGEAMGRLRKGEQVVLTGELYEYSYTNREGQAHKVWKMDVKGVTYLTGICGGYAKSEDEQAADGTPF